MTVFIVMDSENIDRMKSYDPAEFELKKLGHPWNTKRINQIVLMYATKEEMNEIIKCTSPKQVQKALNGLARGWKYRPEMGDHDGPYIGIDIKGN